MLPIRTMLRPPVMLCACSTVLIGATFAAAAPGSTWPGFRGHAMSGVVTGPTLPERWSTTEGVAWRAEIPGRGWSSPIVWNDVVYVTSAVGSGAFKEPRTGIYGNDYVAELAKQGLSNEEILERLRARDIEVSDETTELRYVVYALDAKTGRVKWEREAHRAKPFGGRHRKNTYASETPFTDGERLYVSFGQNVGLFCYTLDGTLLWKKQWNPQPIYLDFGTASSPAVAGGHVYLVHDGEAASYITALDAKTGRELWRTERPSTGFPKSSWMTPFVWTHGTGTEIVTTGHGLVIAYGLDGKERWRIRDMSMALASPLAAHGLLYVGTGSQGDANRPLYAIHPGATGDITPADAAQLPSSGSIAWMHPRASGYTPSPIVVGTRVFAVHDIGILTVLDALSGREIYKARVGGGGRTFSASPIAAGSRVYFLDEEGTTFVVEANADRYTEVARNALDEMSLASPAAAGGALYIRTATKLYKIGVAGVVPRPATRQLSPPVVWWDRHVAHGVEAGRRGEDLRDRVHRDRGRRHVAVHPARDLRVDARRAFDQRFGNATPLSLTQPGPLARQGFEVLAWLDEPAQGGNGDRLLTSAEAFGLLRLWIDHDHDGVSHPVEIFALSAKDVVEIEVDAQSSNRLDQFGNEFRYRARVKPPPLPA